MAIYIYIYLCAACYSGYIGIQASVCLDVFSEDTTHTSSCALALFVDVSVFTCYVCGFFNCIYVWFCSIDSIWIKVHMRINISRNGRSAATCGWNEYKQGKAEGVG